MAAVGPQAVSVLLVLRPGRDYSRCGKSIQSCFPHSMPPSELLLSLQRMFLLSLYLSHWLSQIFTATLSPMGFNLLTCPLTFSFNMHREHQRLIKLINNPTQHQVMSDPLTNPFSLPGLGYGEPSLMNSGDKECTAPPVGSSTVSSGQVLQGLYYPIVHCGPVLLLLYVICQAYRVLAVCCHLYPAQHHPVLLQYLVSVLAFLWLTILQVS